MADLRFDGRVAVVEVFVPAEDLHAGVTRTWLVLTGLGFVHFGRRDVTS